MKLTGAGAGHLAAVAATIALGVTSPGLAAPTTGFLVPPFNGPGSLGRNVSTAIYLQIWRTLRRAPWPNPKGLDFGSGIANYETEPHPSWSAQAAIGRAEEVGDQFVLWGDASPLGNGVVVQAYLAAPETEAAGTAEDWVVGAGDASVRLGLPRRVFDFDPVTLRKDVVEQYSAPDGLMMCRTKALPCQDLPLTDDWLALEHDNVWAHVRNKDGVAGWLHLTDIDKIPNPIADFTSALVAYDRGDFAQAEAYFRKVMASEAVSSSVRADAAVLAEIAAIRLGAPNSGALERLADDDPYSLYAFEALCMQRLSEAMSKPKAGTRSGVAAVRRLVDLNRGLFPADSKWLSEFDNFDRAYGA